MTTVVRRAGGGLHVEQTDATLPGIGEQPPGRERILAALIWLVNRSQKPSEHTNAKEAN